MTFVVTEEICNEVEIGNQLFHFLTSVLTSDLSFLKTFTAQHQFESSKVDASGQLRN